MKKRSSLLALLLAALLLLAACSQDKVAQAESALIEVEEQLASDGLLGQGGTASAPTADAAVNQALSAVTFTTMQGEEHTLADYTGKPLLLNFSGTWCPPCQREFPELQKLYEEHGEVYNVLVVFLGDTHEDVSAYMEEKGLTFPAVNDEKGTVAALFEAGAVVPQSFVLDAAGNTVDTITGATNLETMLDKLETAS